MTLTKTNSHLRIIKAGAAMEKPYRLSTAISPGSRLEITEMTGKAKSHLCSLQVVWTP